VKLGICPESFETGDFKNRCISVNKRETQKEKMNERNEVLRRLSKGIQEHRVTDADILSVAIENRKRKLASTKTNVDHSINYEKRKKFNQEICDPSTTLNKENVNTGTINVLSYPASPYKALSGFYEAQYLKEKKKQLAKSELISSASVESEDENDPSISSFQDSTQVQNEDSAHDDIPEMTVPDYEDCLIFSSKSSAIPSIHSSSSSSSTPHSEKPSLSSLRAMMLDHLLSVLNSGSYDELLSLKGIGKVRTMRIFTRRNAGKLFDCLDDLERIGMNAKNIERFVIANCGYLVGKI
jgi:DNA uptake protein ComE-like DNA-binding protein